MASIDSLLDPHDHFCLHSNLFPAKIQLCIGYFMVVELLT